MVVDIKDSDTYVVDRLSRECAMHAMYPNGVAGGISIMGEHHRGECCEQYPIGESAAATVHRNRSDQEKNFVFFRLPEQQQQEQVPQHPQTIPPIHNMSFMIQEDDDDDDDDTLEEVSLDSFSGIKKVRPIYSPHLSNPIYIPSMDPTKRKKVSVKKIFDRKKK